MKRRQKGSQVKEGELDKLTMCGKGPKQHDKKCKKKNKKTPQNNNRIKGAFSHFQGQLSQASSQLQPGHRSKLSGITEKSI